jgi:hypothetical protein
MRKHALKVSENNVLGQMFGCKKRERGRSNGDFRHITSVRTAGLGNAHTIFGSRKLDARLDARLGRSWRDKSKDNGRIIRGRVSK